MKLLVVLLLGVFCCLVQAEVIDLTHSFGKRTIYWPGNPPFNFTNVFRLPGTRGAVAEANAFQTAEHSGTHMDAPRHFCPTGKQVHDITMEKLQGPGVVLDLKAEAEADRDFEVMTETILDWEKINGIIPNGAIILLNFGWQQFWPNRTRVFNTDDFTSPAKFHFPGLSPSASKWLTENRKVNAVGGDTPSLDYGQSRDYETHVTLLCDHEVIILENVANLDDMPATGTRVFIGALKLENGSGTPVRLFAVTSSASGNFNVFSSIYVGILTACYYFTMTW